MSDDYTQNLISRVGALDHALELALREIAVISGKNAKATIESLRNTAVDNFRNSDIGPEREMDHAQIAGPAIEALKLVFDRALQQLPDENDPNDRR